MPTASRLQLLPLPPFNLGLPKGHERRLLASFAAGESVPHKRVEILLEGHVAALWAISKPWADALKMKQKKILKRWAHGLLPLRGQPSGPAQAVGFNFANVGRNYVKRDNSFRSRAKNLTRPYTKWLTTAKRAAAKARSVLNR